MLSFSRPPSLYDTRPMLLVNLHGGRLNRNRSVRVRREIPMSARQRACRWSGTEKALREVPSPKGRGLGRHTGFSIPASPVLPQGIPRSGKQDATPLSREVSRRFSPLNAGSQASGVGGREASSIQQRFPAVLECG